MISNESLKIHWINKISKEHNNLDKILIEKTIRALILVEELAKAELPFIFKGGTALMLLFKATKRISIDVDILVSKNFDIARILERVIEKSMFIKFEKQTRRIKSSIQKEHYKIFYRPTYKTYSEQDYILLDVLFEKNNYVKTPEVNLESIFVKSEGHSVKVKIPSPEDFLGDKLTAFAPTTTGIPFEKSGRSMAMEIIKQLYDIGNLFDIVHDVNIVRQTFLKFALQELRYRGLKIESEMVLDDIYRTSLAIATRGYVENERYEKLKNGISRIRPFIFSEVYHLDKAIIHASKIAYLVKLLQTNQQDIKRFGNSSEVINRQIEAPFVTKLNKLKKSNPEAFFIGTGYPY